MTLGTATLLNTRSTLCPITSLNIPAAKDSPPEALLNNSKNLQDLITSVAKETSLPEDQSAAAVTATLRYLTARLPSPAVGQLHELLQTNPNDLQADESPAEG